MKTISTFAKYSLSFIACAVMAFTAGCASGGFKLTRTYAQFINKQNIFIRIILYILTSVVFAVTLIADFVIFNTVDFWEGKVSAGDYKFQDAEKTYFVHHEILPEGSLKRSTIKVMSDQDTLLQTVVLQETPNKNIELYIDGKLRTNVQDIYGLPVASSFDSKGQLISEKLLLLELSLPIASQSR